MVSNNPIRPSTVADPFVVKKLAMTKVDEIKLTIDTVKNSFFEKLYTRIKMEMNIVIMENLLNVNNKAINENINPEVKTIFSNTFILLYRKIRNQTVIGMLKLYIDGVAFGCLKKDIA